VIEYTNVPSNIPTEVIASVSVSVIVTVPTAVWISIPSTVIIPDYISSPVVVATTFLTNLPTS